MNEDSQKDWQAVRHRALIADALDLLKTSQTDSIAHLRPGLCRYLEDRIETGGFLRAVLENDMAAAVTHAHPSLHMSQMKALVELIAGSFPAPAWGSAERVRAWLSASDE